MAMCYFLFKKNEQFYKFITSKKLACKKYTSKHTFKDSKNWSKVIHYSFANTLFDM